MSIRASLQQVLHVAPPIGMQHATNFSDTATDNATPGATTCDKASSDAVLHATSYATVAQQSVESDATLTEQQRELHRELVRNGGTAWMWQVTLTDRTLIVTTSPASTMAEMVETYPDAIRVEVIE